MVIRCVVFAIWAYNHLNNIAACGFPAIHRNSFNITAMSFEPEQIYAEIKKHIPDFQMEYKFDELRQGIADSWPNCMDDHCAREEWGFKPTYDLAAMTVDMIKVLKEKLK